MMTARRILLTLTTLIVSSGTLVGAENRASGRTYGLLRGIVVDGEGNPIPGATVQVGRMRPQIQSGRTGIFSVLVPSSSYEVRVSASGYAQDVLHVVIAAGETQDVAAILAPPPAPTADTQLSSR